MRLARLILWDMKLQAKYGFYFLYGILTALYLILISALPAAWRRQAAAILLFSDPAAMGLFFMGAIVLLEKSQRVNCAYSASPVRAVEYVISKTVSLCVIASASAAVIAAAAGIKPLALVLSGILLSGFIFTLTGVIIATRITSLNQFLLWTVPVEAAGFVPAILHALGITPEWLRFYPANICIEMVSGKVPPPAGIFLVLLLAGVLLAAAARLVGGMWREMGGAKL